MVILADRREATTRGVQQLNKDIEQITIEQRKIQDLCKFLGVVAGYIVCLTHNYFSQDY